MAAGDASRSASTIVAVVPSPTGLVRLQSSLKARSYDALDLMTLRRGVPRRINGTRLRLPPEWSRYYGHVYQPDTARFLVDSCVSGTTVADIGAHIGLFTVVMAHAVGPDGRVVSFEPTPSSEAALERVVRMNDVAGRVDAVRAAVGEASGRAVFHISDVPGDNGNSLVAEDRPGRKVDVVSIDEHLGSAGRVSCLKIDVEGAELGVVRGGLQVIERHRPAIALDVHPRTLPEGAAGIEELVGLLVDLGYGGTVDGVAWRPAELAARTDTFEILLRHGASPEAKR
jgi:FkbM family methyltransferase